MDPRTKLAIVRAERATLLDGDVSIAIHGHIVDARAAAGIPEAPVTDDSALAELEAEVAGLDASAASGLDDDTVTKLVLDMKINEVEALRAEIEALRPTLRDQFAMAALAGLLPRGDIYPEAADHNAGLAYGYASAMLTAREARAPQTDATTRIRELEEALRGLMLSRDAAWKGGHDWDEAVDRAARVLAEVQP